MPVSISEAEKARYERDGVLCLRGALNVDEIEGLRSAVDQQMAQRDQSKTAYDFEQIGADLWRDDQAMREHGATRLDLSICETDKAKADNFFMTLLPGSILMKFVGLPSTQPFQKSLLIS